MGKLIVLEGADGCGKTTQLNLLCARLTGEGRDFRKLEFPRYSEESSALVRLYLAGKFGSEPGDVNAYAASSFYAVDRYASYKSDWERDYLAGKLFVSGRYTTSNAIHQGAKLPPDERSGYFDWLFGYEYGLLGLPKPDAVVLLDIPTELAIKNIAGRGEAADIHETHRSYLESCREAALEAARRFDWRLINCAEGGNMRPAEDIADELYKLIEGIIYA